jgi:hypothetical protein
VYGETIETFYYFKFFTFGFWEHPSTIFRTYGAGGAGRFPQMNADADILWVYLILDTRSGNKDVKDEK